MSANVRKIIINIGGDEKTLSLEEARELRNALNDLFGPALTTKEIVERIVYPPWPRYYGPYWTVTAGQTSGTISVQLNSNRAMLTS